MVWHLKTDGLPDMCVVIPRHCVDTMHTRHFRGRGLRHAANFSRWDSPYAVLGDRRFREIFHHVCTEIAADLKREPPEHNTGYDQRFIIPFPGIVGWSGTVPRSYVNGAELEEFRLNVNATGLKVMDDHPLAPITSLVSCTTRFRLYEKDPLDQVIMLYSLSPGPNIGELDGNVSKREDIVFFDLGHRGGNNLHPADAEFR